MPALLRGGSSSPCRSPTTSTKREELERPSELSQRGDDIAGLHKKRKAGAIRFQTHRYYIYRQGRTRGFRDMDLYEIILEATKGIAALGPQYSHASETFSQGKAAASGTRPITAYGRQKTELSISVPVAHPKTRISRHLAYNRGSEYDELKRLAKQISRLYTMQVHELNLQYR